MNTKKIGIIGGDMRQYFLAKSLKKDGNDVKLFGFENLPNKTEQLSECSLKELDEFSEYIILPLPISRDGKTLNAPFSLEKIKLKNLHDNLKNKKIFGGIISPEIKSLFDENSKIYDFCREDFSILNAVPTAEGAIKEVFENSDKTIFSSKCLVTGYGKIGKVLCKLLKNMGADVTASMRSIQDFAWAKTDRIKAVHTEKLSENSMNFDIIFNTIPSIIFNRKLLEKCHKETLIIDLASNPGGIDKTAATDLKIKIIHSLGIPGKYFPETAAEIIKTTIYKIAEEEKL